jgi:hypothetical protein
VLKFIQSSGWIDHGHHEDQAYENVVLHVVWEEDKPISEMMVKFPSRIEGTVSNQLLKNTRS